MCWELLTQIKALTFLVHDVEALEKLEDYLRDLLEDMKQHVPLEDGLTKESVSDVRRSPMKGTYWESFAKTKA